MPTPSLPRIARTLFCLAGVLFLIAPAGCESTGGARPDESRLVDPAPIVERYNARTSRVTTLWARASAGPCVSSNAARPSRSAASRSRTLLRASFTRPRP